MNLTRSNNWKMMDLGVLAVFSNGRTSPTRLDSGEYPVYGANGIIGFSNQKNKKENSIVIGRVGSYCGSLYFSDKESWVTDNAIACNARENSNPKFIFYLLSTLNLNSRATGSGQPLINQAMLNSIEVFAPESLDEQKEIAELLGCLDDKIELLRRESKTLEELAQTLFKEWFVNFRFPGATGKMIDSELGEIPDGWRLGKLDNIAEITSGKRPLGISEKQTKDFQYPLLGASSIMGYVNDFLFDQEVFVIGRVGTHGLIQRFSEKIWPSDNTLVLYSKYPEYLYQILRTINFELLNKGAVQPLITQSDMKAFEIFLPKEEVLLGFERAAGAWSMKTKNNNSEVQTLSKLRDELLNKIFNI